MPPPRDDPALPPSQVRRASGADHAFRTLDNVVATPHLGYVSRQQYKVWYEDTVQHLNAWLDTRSATLAHDQKPSTSTIAWAKACGAS
jgi:phosphoglycerate dehydrogenase-like enzyme